MISLAMRLLNKAVVAKVVLGNRVLVGFLIFLKIFLVHLERVAKEKPAVMIYVMTLLLI